MANKYAPLEERFWSRVEKTDGCWKWHGSKHKGYGLISKNGSLAKVHRVSYELHIGPIPEGMHVLHKCDNPECSNPDHLFLGNHADNMKDMFDKRRHPSFTKPENYAKGEKAPSAKLTAKDVLSIRRRYVFVSWAESNCRELAEEFGVTMSSIRCVMNGRTWRHVQLPSNELEAGI